MSEVDDAKAHSGILRAAVYVASTISDKQLLDAAFQKAPVSVLLVHSAVVCATRHPNSLVNTDCCKYLFCFCSLRPVNIWYDTIQRLHSKTNRTCQFSLAHKN